VSPYDSDREPVVVVISGPSGVGKDTIIKQLVRANPNLHFVVTTTDRAPRADEQDGVDYHFITTSEFEHMIRSGQLLEHAVVYGQYKGVSKEEVVQALATGKDIVMRLDVQGAMTVRRLIPEAILVFLLCESENALANRLLSRRTESAECIRERLATARRELKWLRRFDYLVINRDHEIDKAVQTILEIIETQKCRVWQRRVTVREGDTGSIERSCT
jgi:guanylate kinase